MSSATANLRLDNAILNLDSIDAATPGVEAKSRLTTLPKGFLAAITCRFTPSKSILLSLSEIYWLIESRSAVGRSK
jgi:hypothetical protein